MSVHELSVNSFAAEVLQSDLPVLVDFWAPWCGPCKALTPTIEKVALETEGKVKVVKCNIDSCPEIAGRYSIMSIPTLLIFYQGEIAGQLVGLVQKDKILDKLKAYM
ncbi:MAG: thioredoxin [Candidatus Cloacimonadaceae bacterium]|nr:thioredoxin [Candidatus Cloacimonadaceae bacterium]